jgi:hypothetical protein
MGNKDNSERPIYFSLAVLRSKAYGKLSAIEIRVLNEFYIRRVVIRQRGRVGRGDSYKITNNGEIVLPAGHTAKELGVSKSSVKRAIRALIELGFVDLGYIGGGLQGDCHKYAISDRWKNYGTENFEYKSPATGNHGQGFTASNWEERTGKNKSRYQN